MLIRGEQMGKRKQQPKQTDDSSDVHERIRSGVPRSETPQSPLGAEHLNALNEVIRECTHTADMCNACQDAGIDVEPEIQANTEQLDMAKKLKAHFFPHAS